jgi:hypothetical protein
LIITEYEAKQSKSINLIEQIIKIHKNTEKKLFGSTYAAFSRVMEGGIVTGNIREGV